MNLTKFDKSARELNIMKQTKTLINKQTTKNQSKRISRLLSAGVTMKNKRLSKIGQIQKKEKIYII